VTQIDQRTDTVRRGRPRDTNVDTRILRAVIDELARAGVAAFSVNSVATRAGVAKRSIYSRWPERDQLILAGLATLAADLTPPGTGHLESDLRALLDQILRVFDGSRWNVMMRCLLELDDHPELHATAKHSYYDPCMAVVEGCLADARHRGELRPDVDVVLAAETFTNALVGLGSAMSNRDRSDPAVRRQLLDIIVHGLA
jgi:AcrR family transcriptional regulator